MNTVMIIPTGIGCEIGGHAGDANPVAKLLGSVSDILVLHPNAVNASDINEMPSNSLYVEGSILDRFLEGEIELQTVKNNKILLVVNSPICSETINAVSAGRVTLGADIEILELETPLIMTASLNKETGKADGTVTGWKELVEQVNGWSFDALAITSSINVSKEIALNYLKNGGVNPWGGIEAKTSRLIATELNKPVAHAPMDTENNAWIKYYQEVVDPRMASEMVSVCFLQSVFKGLHKAPRIGKGLSVKDIDVLVSPYGCWGRPHIACRAMKIAIIIVKENKTICNDTYPSGNDLIFVDNYLEAVGVIKAMNEGICLESLRRPIEKTRIHKNA